ncbi:MAG: hypothetical protein IKA76_06580 [Clostridia bacterium]|nr:hypothetical protein [Clostridia bacterium]
MESTLLRVVGVGILLSAVCLILKPIRGEWIPLIRIGGSVLVFGMLLSPLSDVLEELTSLVGGGAIEPYAQAMLRALGISLLCKIACDVCRDAGEGTLGFGVEMAGKLTILLLCVPLVRELLSYAAILLEGT